MHGAEHDVLTSAQRQEMDARMSLTATTPGVTGRWPAPEYGTVLADMTAASPLSIAQAHQAELEASVLKRLAELETRLSVVLRRSTEMETAGSGDSKAVNGVPILDAYELSEVRLGSAIARLDDLLARLVV